MSMEVGRIDLGLDINKKSFNNQLYGIAGGAEKSVKNAFSGIGTKIGLTLGVAAVASFTKSCLGLGSSLTEVQNVVDTVFPAMNGQVNSFAQNAMEQFGLSETVAKKYMGTLGAMSKSMGFSEQAALSMAEGIAGLSGDVASFYNSSSDEAYTKLKSIWTGETESLKELGVIMTQTNLDQYALNNGFGRTTSSMDEQTKTMLRYQYVTSALSAAQGDFAKTSDSWANQIRVLSLRFDSLKATLGQGFINLFTPILQGLNNLISYLQGAANAFKSFTELVTGKKIETSTGAVAANALDATSNILGMGDAAETSAKKAAKSLAGFDELNVISGKDSGSSSIATPGSGITDTAPTGSTKVTDVDNSMLEAFDGFKDKIQPTIDALGRLKKALKPIGEFAFKNIKSFYEDILVPIGKWALNDGLPDLVDAATNLLSDIDWPKLSGAIIDFNKAIAPMAISVGTGFVKFVKDLAAFLKPALATTVDLLADALSAIADSINGVDSKTWEDAGYGIGLIGTAIAGIKIVAGLPAFLLSAGLGLQSLALGLSNLAYLNPIALPALFDLLGLDEWLDDLYLKLPEWARGLWEGLWQAVYDMVAAVFNFDQTFKIWEEVVAAFKEAFDGDDDAWYEIGGNIIKGIFLGIAGILSFPIEVVADFFDTLWKSICDVFGIASPAKEMKPLGENILLGVLGGFKDTFVSWWASISGWGAQTMAKFGEWAGKTWGAVKTAFTSAPIWLKAKFDTAWLNIKNAFAPFAGFFTGLWDGIKTGFSNALWKLKDLAKGPINAVIGILNALITAMNKISFDIPDWGVITGALSGKSFGFNMPKITPLAQGGYVGANQPRLAMIGDNKREGEIVSPESKFQEMLNAAAQLSGGGITEEILYRVMSRVFRENQLMLVPDANGIFKLVKIESDEYHKSTGKLAFGD